MFLRMPCPLRPCQRPKRFALPVCPRYLLSIINLTGQTKKTRQKTRKTKTSIQGNAVWDTRLVTAFFNECPQTSKLGISPENGLYRHVLSFGKPSHIAYLVVRLVIVRLYDYKSSRCTIIKGQSENPVVFLLPFPILRAQF